MASDSSNLSLHMEKQGKGLAGNIAASPQPPREAATAAASPNDQEFSRSQVTSNSEALLAAIVDSSDDAIISNDLNGIITSWNKSAERIFGYNAGEVIGQPTSLLTSPGRQEDSTQILEKVRHGETIDHYETMRRHKDGSEIAVLMTVFPLRNARGELIGASKVTRDITSNRHAEEVLRNTDKLALAGRMAASIAHEINNPLEAITNLLYLVEHQDLSDEARSYLTLAQHELARVSQIASQTLGFFRGDRNVSTAPLSEIVDSAISLHVGRFSTSNVAVHKEYTQLTPPSVHQGELRQVLVNLVGNALDAMPQGGRLRIRIHRSMDHSSHPKNPSQGVRIVIADTGTGMNKATQRQIFEPFFTTKGSSGTGLGLWVSSQIIARHRGRISVRSSQSPAHSGTVFSIFLPLFAKSPISGHKEEEDAEAQHQRTPTPIGGSDLTSRGDASDRIRSAPDRPSTAYNAA